MSIFIDEEFQNLIPPLSKEEYTQLEANCVKDGIRDPLVVWPQPDGNNILVDGHNRWNISAQHGGIRFETIPMQFESREAVKEWIIKNQLGRRNIPPYVRAELALKLKPVIAERAKERQGTRNDLKDIPQKSAGSETRDELAKAAGVSHDTIHKVEKIQAKAPEETKEALRRGELSINSVYSGIIASENETRRQRENRELREAKKRADDFEEKKSDEVVEFSELKQHKEDNSLIFGEFSDNFRKMYSGILLIAGNIDEDIIMNAIKTADVKDLKKIADDLMFSYRCILKIQKKIAEVIDEK